MKFLIRRRFQHMVRSVVWKGRCGALHLFQRGTIGGQHFNVFVVGVHLSHGDLQIDALSDAAHLLRMRPWGSKILVVGDFNVDQLPISASDPFPDSPHRSLHHHFERLRLQSWSDHFRLAYVEPQCVFSSPGGPFNEACMVAPITRIPVGQTSDSCLPSLIDYGFASKDLVASCAIHWDGVPADHAIISFSLKLGCALQRGKKTRWKCRDEKACIAWIQEHAPSDFADLRDFHSFLHAVQNEWADLETCKRRRDLRLPHFIRSLYATIANSTDETLRHSLQKLAWRARCDHVKDCRTKLLRREIFRGGVPCRSKKLSVIQGVKLSSDVVSFDPSEWGDAVLSQFGGKWGCHDLQGRMNILDFVLAQEGNGVSFPFSALSAALDRIRRKPKLDHYGISVSSLQIVAHACPTLLLKFLELASGSTPILSSVVVRGRVFGKDSSITAAHSMRAILPQPALMQVLDALIPLHVSHIIERAMPAQMSCFIGALPKTQCLDVAHGLQFIIEKGLDDYGRGALAQADIEKYYDSLPVLSIVRWLCRQGLQENVAACILRHQMCPKVVLACGATDVPLPGRCIGGLTGSRTAGILGRIPVESIAADRHEHWKQWAFRAAGDHFCLCSWVDNLFAASASLHGAISILEDFEDQLQSKWRMKIKPSSRACMRARGSDELPADPVKWPLCHQFIVLGHSLDDDGSIRSCWRRARASMWKAFWANPGSKVAANFSATERLALLARTVSPQLDFRCSRWPPQKQIASELDSMQRKMTGALLRIQREPHESVEDYVRRRGRFAAKVCRQHGLWSARWFSRAAKWDAHLARSKNSRTWAARLRTYRGSEWLQERRRSFMPRDSWASSSLAGRTDTRAYRGRIHMRWQDGIALANG